MNEHTQFKIDTSGAVDAGQGIGTVWHWSDLSPFQQGAVEALFAERMPGGFERWGDAYGFSDLSTSALQRIMADCERWLALYPKSAATVEGGWNMWRYRQEQMVERPDFPPIHLSLAEDGLIHLSEVGE